jgi:hypothetical protein
MLQNNFNNPINPLAQAKKLSQKGCLLYGKTGIGKGKPNVSLLNKKEIEDEDKAPEGQLHAFKTGGKNALEATTNLDTDINEDNARTLQTNYQTSFHSTIKLPGGKLVYEIVSQGLLVTGELTPEAFRLIKDASQTRKDLLKWAISCFKNEVTLSTFTEGENQLQASLISIEAELNQQVDKVRETLETLVNEGKLGEEAVLEVVQLKELLENGVIVSKEFLARGGIEREYSDGTTGASVSESLQASKNKIVALLRNDKMAEYYKTKWPIDRGHTIFKLFRRVCNSDTEIGQCLDFSREANIARGGSDLISPQISFNPNPDDEFRGNNPLSAVDGLLFFTINSFLQRNVLILNQLPVLTFSCDEADTRIFNLVGAHSVPSDVGVSLGEDFEGVRTQLLKLGSVQNQIHVNRAGKHVVDFIDHFRSDPNFKYVCGHAARNEVDFPPLLLHTLYWEAVQFFDSASIRWYFDRPDYQKQLVASFTTYCTEMVKMYSHLDLAEEEKKLVYTEVCGLASDMLKSLKDHITNGPMRRRLNPSVNLNQCEIDKLAESFRESNLEAKKSFQDAISVLLQLKANPTFSNLGLSSAAEKASRAYNQARIIVIRKASLKTPSKRGSGSGSESG